MSNPDKAQEVDENNRINSTESIEDMKMENMTLLEATKIARDWFDRFANDEPVWENQPAANIASILTEAIRND